MLYETFSNYIQTIVKYYCRDYIGQIWKQSKILYTRVQITRRILPAYSEYKISIRYE